jgi:transposase-like protein
MLAVLQNPIFQDDAKAREWLEARVWPNGPICPHCGNADEAKIRGLQGKAHRPGLYQCAECREQFTVTVGTVFERSKVPLSKWLAALFLMTASKKGISAHQIHRTLKLSYKTAWFLMHRLREAMRTGGLEPMGGAGKVVEVDETIFGFQQGTNSKSKHKSVGAKFRNVVLTLVERGGSARSFHIDGTTVATLLPIIRANINRESALMTDEGAWYTSIGQEFASHGTVKHTANEYVRGQISTNTVEGYYSIFKRGMKGVYQHCSEKHLHRYLAEFDFRYSNRVALGIDDEDRAALLAKGIVGKRLTYRRPHQARLQSPS